MFIVAPCLLLQSQSIRITATLDSTNYPVGDWINIQLSAEHSYNTKMLWNIPVMINSVHFEKLSESAIDSIQQKDFLTENRTITVTSFDTGVLLIPPIASYFLENGITDTVITEPLSVYITSVAVDTTATVRLIKPPFSIATAKPNLLWYLIPLLFLLILIIAGWYFLKEKKRKTVHSALQDMDTRLPHEKADDLLRKLEMDKPWEHKRIKQFYVEITQILREYMEAGLGLPALENTTHEIITSLRKKSIDENLLQQLNENLHVADLVKFAKAEPAETVHLHMLDTVKEFVQKTKPATLSTVQEELQA
ncbi:MAG: hypothetical protein IPO83_08730 [Chitinophagaceae bacterium]|nr:hypothetical protein [Chitinophagaceae bacterium]